MSSDGNIVPSVVDGCSSAEISKSPQIEIGKDVSRPLEEVKKAVVEEDLCSEEEGADVDLMPYIQVTDFGEGEFPDNHQEVIDDFFSAPASKKPESNPSTKINEDDEGERDMFVDSEAEIDDSTIPDENIQENADDDSFFEKECCSKFQCNRSFEKEVIVNHRRALKENDMLCGDSINHHTLFLLGQISALVVTDDIVETQKTVKQRERHPTVFMFQGREVCKSFYLFANSCGKTRFSKLKKQHRMEGPTGKPHGNKGKTPHNVTKFEIMDTLRLFLKNFSNVHGLVLPGRTFHIYNPKLNPDLRILPSSFTKKFVHNIYQQHTEHPVSYNLFAQLWNKLFPNIVIQKPRTDLCPTCAKLTMSAQKLAGLSLEESRKHAETTLEHISLVMSEREHYSRQTKSIEDGPSLQPCTPLSFAGTMHYSFDFAQQIFLPYSSQQVGPLYFLTPYKVALFGVACEPLGKFVLYIIPESAAEVGKGSNAVISMLHHFFENFSVGEQDVVLHADNCTGQNKNNYLFQYGVWRTLQGYHNTFKISFLPVGHTKFAPDLFFGCVKKVYSRSCVNSLEELKAAILASCGNKIIPFVVGNEAGELNMTFYDWQSYFKKIHASRTPGILKNYHFEASKEFLGELRYKKTLSSELRSSMVLSNPSILQEHPMPAEIKTSGLSHDRMLYLNLRVREFVSDECKDILCPRPPDLDEREPPKEVVVKTTNVSEKEDTAGTSQSAAASAPAKKQAMFKLALKPTKERKDDKEKKERKASACGYCHETGHTNRVKDGVPVCPRRLHDEKN